MRAHPVKRRYWRAQERPRPPVRACRWPRRAGVPRGGHHWRARRACEPGQEPRAQTRVADSSSQVRRTQTHGHHKQHRRARHGVGDVALSGAPTIGSSVTTPRACVSMPRLRERRALGRVGRARSARRVLPASPRHALRLQSAGTADGHEGRATWVTVPIAIVALRRDAARTAALATRLFSQRPPPPPGRGDGLASAAGFVRSHGTGGRRGRCIACQQGPNDARASAQQ